MVFGPAEPRTRTHTNNLRVAMYEYVFPVSLSPSLPPTFPHKYTPRSLHAFPSSSSPLSTALPPGLPLSLPPSRSLRRYCYICCYPLLLCTRREKRMYLVCKLPYHRHDEQACRNITRHKRKWKHPMTVTISQHMKYLLF